MPQYTLFVADLTASSLRFTYCDQKLRKGDLQRIRTVEIKCIQSVKGCNRANRQIS